MKRQINGKTYSKTIGIKKGSLLAAGKDGDIEEYKADATDAGKVLTVGEDGSVAPASADAPKLFYHNVNVYFAEEESLASFSFLSYSATQLSSFQEVYSAINTKKPLLPQSFFDDASFGYFYDDDEYYSIVEIAISASVPPRIKMRYIKNDSTVVSYIAESEVDIITDTVTAI